MAKTKQQLKVENNTQFPNNNTNFITPAKLREFNVDMIDSTVNELEYIPFAAGTNAFTASVDSRVTTLEGEVDTLQASTGSYATTGSNTFIGNQTINGNVSASFFVGDGSGLTNLPSATPTGSLLVTASAAGNTITFTKGDASTFDVTVSGGTVNTGSFVTTGSNTFVGNQTISGSVTITGSLTASGFTYPTVDGVFGVEVIKTDGAGNLELEIPKTIYEYVKNVSGGTLYKGTPVHSVGTVGFQTEVIAADAGNPSTMPATFILAQNLDDEGEGLGIAIGAIQGVDTTGLSAGDPVWVAVGGGWTQTKPTGSALIQNLGIVTKVGVNGGGIVLGAGRSNDVPNLPPNTLWVGSSNWVATPFSASNFYTGSYTGSFVGDGSGLTGIPSGDSFPYTGSAVISGSLTITGSAYGNVGAITIASNTASLDMRSANFFTLTMPSSSVTHFDFTNPLPGQTAMVLVRTNTASTASFSSNVRQITGSMYTPSPSGSSDILTFVSFDSTNVFMTSLNRLV